MQTTRRQQGEIILPHEPPILYKYVPFDRTDILTNKEIRFSGAHSFNDPFEIFPAIVSALKRGHDIVRLQEVIGCIGILCLTSKPDNLLMWTHYCNAHTGFVIGFDTSHSFFGSTPEKVNYATEYKRLTDDDLNLLCAQDEHKLDSRVGSKEMLAREFLLRKTIDWSYEDEYRVFKPFSLSNRVLSPDAVWDKGHLFCFPPECIKYIIMGAKSDKKTIKSIVRNDTSYSHTMLIDTLLSPESYRLIFHAI